MDVDNIRFLSLVLQKHEAEILDGNKKLSLTASLLQNINFAFQALEYYDSANPQNAISVETVKFLQELFRRTPKVAITQRVKCDTWRVDLSRFDNLKYLELSRIPMHLVEGLQSLRSQLEVLVCIRCTDCFEEIIGPADQIWDELRTAKLSYNNLDFISSFVNMPVLQYLDLSYNKISVGYDLQALTNLKYLNLSFNYLISVPVLSDEVCRKLQVLILSNNYIQDLAAVGLMENLTLLDVSGNLLADHSAVSPLLFLPVLERLNLLSNPLSYHPYHRFYTCSYLNKDINRKQFDLDGKALSPLEQTVVGSRGQTFNVRGRQFRTSSMSNSQTCAGLPQVPNIERSFSTRKVGRVREAVIMEGTDHLGEVPKLPKQPTEPGPLKEHLETKKQLEVLRERIGKDHWLHSQSGSFVQDLLGFQKSEGSSRQLTSTPYESDYLSSSPNFYSAISGSDQTLTSLQNVETSAGTSEFVTAQSTQTIVNISNTDQSGTSSSKEEELIVKSEEKTPDEEIIVEADILSDEVKFDETEPEEELEDEGADLWLVQKILTNNQREELFLILNETELREKNTQTGRTIEKWYIESIESCVKLTNVPITVQLTFQTVRRDRQERTYVMEFPDSQTLLQKIGAMLESRSLTAMNQVVFRCMKCSSLFSQELNNRYKAGLQGKTTTVCPTCGSNLVIEIDEVPLPSANKTIDKSTIDTTPTQSSIGSADSLQNVDSSGTKSEAPTPRRYDSDIEVISNPSQSSIEVLESRMQGIITPNRKRSSEERQTVAVPQLVTVPEIHPNMTGLTESSSSGSLTDSVCTAYENHPPGQSKKVTTGLTDTVPEESSSPALSTTYASLLEGLLKSVSSKFSPSKVSTKGVSIYSPIQFSYKDFTQVDHRIKLHLFQQVYQHDSEDLLFLLKGHIVSSSGEDYEGCVVLSTHYVYILRILPDLETSGEVSNWFQFKISHPIKDLLSVSSILWSQGIRVDLTNNTYIVLLQDTQRTLDFLTFLSDLQQEIKVNKQPELSNNEKVALSKVISPCVEHENEEGLTFLQFVVCSSVQIAKGQDHKSYKFAPVFVTNTDVVLLQPHYSWLLKDFTTKPECICVQKISNIVDVLRDGDVNVLVIQYLDEAENQEEIWILDLATTKTLEAFVESIREPWETLFSVPLQISKPKRENELKSNVSSVIL